MSASRTAGVPGAATSPGFTVTSRYRARGGRAELVARELLGLGRERGGALLDGGLRPRELLGARAVAEQLDARLQRRPPRGRLLQRGLGAIVLGFRDRTRGDERAAALGLLAREALGRRGGADLVVGGGDVLGASTGLQEREIGARRLELGLPRVARCRGGRVIEGREQRARRDALPAADRHVADASGDLEPDDPLVVLDEALVAGRDVGVAARDDEQHDEGQPVGRHGSHLSVV